MSWVDDLWGLSRWHGRPPAQHNSRQGSRHGELRVGELFLANRQRAKSIEAKQTSIADVRCGGCMNEPKKHTRRSRKSLVGQISDVLFKITRLTDKAFENESTQSIKPAVLNALMAQLDTLRWLQEREDRAKDIPAKVETPAASEIIGPSELDITVAKMLERHAQTPVSKPATPRPVTPVENTDLIFWIVKEIMPTKTNLIGVVSTVQGPLPSGTLKVRLAFDTMIPGVGQIVAGRDIEFTLDQNGALQNSFLWSTALMQSGISNPYYKVCAYTADGQPAWSAQVTVPDVPIFDVSNWLT
jgi:hypothetical protein